MQDRGINPSHLGLDRHAIHNISQAYRNLGTAGRIENALRPGEGLLANNGAPVVKAGHHTGRSPRDTSIVREPSSEERIWWGPIAPSLGAARCDAPYGRPLASLQGGEPFVQDRFAGDPAAARQSAVPLGAHPQHRLPVRIITGYALHDLLARQLFVRGNPRRAHEHIPRSTVIDVPNRRAHPEGDGTRAEAFVASASGAGPSPAVATAMRGTGKGPRRTTRS